MGGLRMDLIKGMEETWQERFFASEIFWFLR